MDFKQKYDEFRTFRDKLMKIAFTEQEIARHERNSMRTIKYLRSRKRPNSIPTVIVVDTTLKKPKPTTIHTDRDQKDIIRTPSEDNNSSEEDRMEQLDGNEEIPQQLGTHNICGPCPPNTLPATWMNPTENNGNSYIADNDGKIMFSAKKQYIETDTNTGM